MLPHMVGEFVVLLFLKLPVVERFRCFRQFTGKRFEQKVDKLRIVENAVNVSPHARTVHDIPVTLPAFQPVQRRSGRSLPPVRYYPCESRSLLAENGALKVGC